MPEHRANRETARTAPQAPRYPGGAWTNSAAQRDRERQRRRDRLTTSKRKDRR